MSLRHILSPAALCLLLLAVPSRAAAKDRSAAAVALSPETWIGADDYPAAATAVGADGISTIRWDVTTEGKAENCTVASSSGSADLDAAACALIVQRARYTPALDRKGRPTRSAATRRVRWVLPIEQPDTSVPYTLQPF